MKFLHTSDWQIGKVFRFVDEATQSVLQDARLEGISRLADVARANGARTVLVAGDVYDFEGLSARTLDQPIERMRQHDALEWHLIPGNHDPAKPNGIWDRLQRKGLPTNVKVHLTPHPIELAEGGAWLLPAPLTRMHALSDLTEWMDQAETPADAVRIGLAHGSVAHFGSDESSTHNYISPTRPGSARLDYLALGDWHGTKEIAPRVWYSGTHETDAFDVEGGGNALLVDIAAPGAVPKISPIATGRFRWDTIGMTIADPDDIGILEERLRTIDADPSRVLVYLTVSGTLSLADRHEFVRRVAESAGAALKWLRLDDSRLGLRPTADDLDSIDHGGFIRTAANRLKAMAEDPANPERDFAAGALQRLYVEHLKIAGAGSL
jgi:DNA repair exonuclease SbcCD nuclease subunit